MSKSTISTFELFQMFPDQESARLYLESRLWPNGVICPTCRKTAADQSRVIEVMQTALENIANACVDSWDDGWSIATNALAEAQRIMEGK